jgi:hypothetical protein
MLGSIIDKAAPLAVTALPQNPEAASTILDSPFMFDFHQLFQDLYIFNGKDYGHDLLCKMTLELKETFVSFEEGEEGQGHIESAVICNFPGLNVEKLIEKVGFDVYLQKIVLFQFQLKILEQLLLFCEKKDAATLVLTIDDADLDCLDIYSQFVASAKKVMTARGGQTEIVIPTDVETYDDIIDFMDKIEKHFRKTLWRGQTTNLDFREYLKKHALSVI